MADNDPIDTHGHTVSDAKEQEVTLDVSAPAASEELPTGANEMVRAQTTEEVIAQGGVEGGGPTR